MPSSKLVRWGGLAAMLGGALFVGSALLIASMPWGCIGDECELRPMRETGIAGALLMLALLVVVGAVGWWPASVTPVVSGGWAKQASSLPRSGPRCR